ncbi:MAG: cadherin-like domain-containing protein, partial [Planctomycetaceae bacterium]|nr:cadherin-like domain-containing protein [Planctomycetaceae bacterium]
TLTPATNAFGSGTVVVEARDAGGNTAQVSQDVTITPVNDAPQAAGESFFVQSDQVLTIGAPGGLLANDADPDSGGLFVVNVSAASLGSLSWSPDGSFTYDPAGGQSGREVITYQVSDGQTLSNVVSLTIDVQLPAAVVTPTTESDTTSGTDSTTSTDGDATTTTQDAPSTDAGTMGGTTTSGPPVGSSGPGGDGLVDVLDDDTDDDLNYLAMLNRPSGLVSESPENASNAPASLFENSPGNNSSRDTDGQRLDALDGDGQDSNRMGGIGYVMGRYELPLLSAQQLQHMLQSESVWEQLDQVEQSIESSASTSDFFVNTTTVTFSTSITLGAVLWTLRGGMLLTTMVAQMPAWRIVDPLVVLESLGSGSDNEDDESLQSMVDRGHTASSDDSAPQRTPDRSPKLRS